jgi:hypothetical protein
LNPVGLYAQGYFAKEYTRILSGELFSEHGQTDQKHIGYLYGYNKKKMLRLCSSGKAAC